MRIFGWWLAVVSTTVVVGVIFIVISIGFIGLAMSNTLDSVWEFDDRLVFLVFVVPTLLISTIAGRVGRNAVVSCGSADRCCRRAGWGTGRGNRAASRR